MSDEKYQTTFGGHIGMVFVPADGEPTFFEPIPVGPLTWGDLRDELPGVIESVTEALVESGTLDLDWINSGTLAIASIALLGAVPLVSCPGCGRAVYAPQVHKGKCAVCGAAERAATKTKMEAEAAINRARRALADAEAALAALG